MFGYLMEDALGNVMYVSPLGVYHYRARRIFRYLIGKPTELQELTEAEKLQMRPV